MKRRKAEHRPALSIKWKVFLYLAAFTGIVLLLLWLLQVVFLDDIYRRTKTNEVRDAADELLSSVDSLLRLESVADTVAQDHDVCILVLRIESSRRASRIVSIDREENCVIHNITDSAVFALYSSAAEREGEYLEHYRFDRSIGKYVATAEGEADGALQSIVYARVVTNQSGETIFILLNSVVSPVTATVKTLHSLLLIVSVVMIGFSLLLALLISRRITKPMTDMSREAKRLAKGDYDVSFPVGSYREIRELSEALRYAADELSKVDRLRRELIANTSHDLRTPLTMITGYAEVMRDLPGENTPENAQIIIDESRRLTSLVNDMLDISQLENGTVPPPVGEVFDLTEAVRQSMHRYDSFCRRDGYHITFFAEESVVVNTDRSKLLQALHNLVNNAITYTGDDKTVALRQEVYSDPQDGRQWVRLSVTDSGVGIPEEHLASIWERYYKIPSSHKRAAQGSGLGLSIVNKLMTLLGGRCGVSSAVGCGSTFWIEIPLTADTPVIEKTT